MYKEVWKRLLAVILSVCMVLGMTDFSTLVVRADSSFKFYQVVVDDKSLVYNGGEQYPDVKVYKDSTTLAVKDTDYKIEWQGDKTSAGTQKFILKGKKEYSSYQEELTYYINPKSFYNTATQKMDSDFTLTMDKLKIDGNNPIVPTKDDNNLKIVYKEKELKGYCIKDSVTTDQAAKNIYNSRSDQDEVYDYFYYCVNNVGATASAEMRIQGVKNFSSRVDVTYTIHYKNFEEDAILPELKDVKYDGKQKEYIPDITIYAKDGITELVKSSDGKNGDYIISYDKDAVTKPGRVTITVTGVGDYVGSTATLEYAIVKDIGSDSEFARDITMKLTTDKVYTGTKITLEDGEIIVRDKGVELTQGTHYEISYIGNNINAGEVPIVISGIEVNGYKGNFQGSFQILSRSMTDKDITISWADGNTADCTYNTEAQEPKIIVKYKEQEIDASNYTVTYTNNKNAGTATVTVQGKENLKDMKTRDFSISRKELSLADSYITVTLDKNDYDYSGGTALEPEVTVTYSYLSGSTYNTYKLEKGLDYTVDYRNNTSAGEASVDIRGIGNFDGLITKTYSINQVDITKISDLKIEGINNNCTYTGEAIQQNGINVYYLDANGVRRNLREGTDYDLTYDDNINVGTSAKVYITGKGNYSGIIEKTFAIEKGDFSESNKNISVKLEYDQVAFDYTYPTPKVTVKHLVGNKTYTLTQDKDYKVEYNYENDLSGYAGIGKVTVTITGLTNFENFREMEFEITEMALDKNADSITIKGLEEFYTYVGEPVEPEKSQLSVWYKNDKLGADDYTMEFSNNNEPGTGIITITAKDNTNFTGSVTKKFIIKGNLSYEGTEISKIADQVYTGKEIMLTKDALTVYYSLTKKYLELGTDFTLEAYKNNKEPGEATVQIAATTNGNYYTDDTIEKPFTILPKDLDDKTIDGKEDPIKLQVADIPNQVYTGSPIYPTLNITYNGYTLQEDTDYKVVKNDATDAKCTVSGAASITIEGMGTHFTGTRTIDFTIDKRTLTLETISVANIDDTRYYKGKAITIENPTFTYTSPDGNLTLESTGEVLKDTYEIGYEDNDKVGTAYLVITPKEDSNFTGTVKVPFKLKGDLSDSDCTTINVIKKKVFTGYAQTLTAGDIQVLYLEQELVLDKDFEIQYTENTNINASESVPFKVVGISEYYVNTNASKENTFVIKPKDIEEEDAEVKEIVVKGIKEDGYTYTGEEIRPHELDGFAITYQASGGNGALTLTEQNETNATGDYTIELKGDTINATTDDKPYIEVTAVEGGNYTGTLEIPYTITPQSVDIDEIVAKNQILDADGLKVVEEKDIEGLVVECDGELVTFENLVVYWMKDNVVKTTLTKKTDYKVSYERRKSTEEGREEEELCFGETKLVMEGLGNYKDTKTVTFMVKGDLGDSNVIVTPIADQPYTAGSGAQPKVKVYYYHQLLEEGVDYELDWKNNKKVADATAEKAPTVIITGIGAFEGSSTEKKFSIIPRNLGIKDGIMKLEGLEKDGYPYTGEEVCPAKLSSLVLKNNGVIVDEDDYTISYKNNVNGGKETDPNPPCVVITAKEGGNYTGSMEVPFTIVGIPLSDKTLITIGSVDDDQVYTGSELQPKVTVKHLNDTLVEGTHYILSWKNNVDVAASTASEAPTVIIEGIGNYSATVEVKFNIVPRDIKKYESEFTVSIAPQTYSGEAFVPDPVVKNAAEQVLEKDKDYTVSAGTNNVDAGTEATITITGIGNYTGTITPQFTINPQPISNEEEFVISGIVDKVYNSKEQTQQPTITWMEKKTTDDATDNPSDDVTDDSEEDATDGLENDVTDGSENDVTDGSEDDVTDGSEGDDSTAPQVKRELTTDDYTITYTNHVNAGTAMAVITGTGNYTGSRTVYFKIAQRSLSDNGILVKDIVNQVYTGSELTPIPEIYYQDAELGINTKLVSGTDYTIAYSNNNKVGANIATVKITGKGNYSGTTSTTFTIVGNIALANVSSIGVQNYTGKAIEPKPTVTQAGKTLVEGTDYSLSYSNNVEAGTATITIKGINEYGGTKKVTFAICRDISAGIAVVGLGAKYLYTGSAIVPTLGKVSAYGKVLTLNKDYIVTVTNNINVGTATLKVEGIGIYKGVKTFNFDIVRRSVSQCSVSSISTKTYTGKALTPAITVSYNKKTLTPGTDYTLVYQNNTLPGTASIIIKGKGNLSGSKIVTFKIKMAKISKAKAKTADTDKIKVSWKKQSTVTGYQIYNNKNKKVAQIKGNSNTSYTITGLKAGTTYKYKVRAYVIKNGRTCYSAFTSLMTVSTKPEAPSITVKSSKSKQAVISWKKVSGASGYEIYRSTKKSSGYKKLTTTKKLTYTNKKLTANKKYYYKVRAYRTVDGKKIYSSYSSVKYVTIKK